jgi:hypothetical protein
MRTTLIDVPDSTVRASSNRRGHTTAPEPELWHRPSEGHQYRVGDNHARRGAASEMKAEGSLRGFCAQAQTTPRVPAGRPVYIESD